MIDFNYETDFELDNEEQCRQWIRSVIASEQRSTGELTYIFCSDEYLHRINLEYLDHDTYTDIISFDYTEGDIVSGDIFISIDRVRENALAFQQSFEEELRRVIIHGVLHFCGYPDKTESEAKKMRLKEDEKLQLFHVEH